MFSTMLQSYCSMKCSKTNYRSFFIYELILLSYQLLTLTVNHLDGVLNFFPNDNLIVTVIRDCHSRVSKRSAISNNFLIEVCKPELRILHVQKKVFKKIIHIIKLFRKPCDAHKVPPSLNTYTQTSTTIILSSSHLQIIFSEVFSVNWLPPFTYYSHKADMR